MAVTNFSPLLGLALPTTGDLQGTWGSIVNDSITSLLDSAVAGTVTLATDVDVTLTTTLGTTNTSREAILLWTATGTVTRYITAPAQSKFYVVINATGGTQSIVIRGVGPTTGVTIPAGARALVAWNGADFVKVSSTIVNLASDVIGTLPVANGGTGVTTSTGTGNTVLSTSPTLVTPILGTPQSVTLTSATGLPLTTGVTGTLPVANGGTGVTTSTGSGNTVLSTSPTLVTPILGTPTSGTLTNATGLPLTTGVTGILPIANGGTATATPGLVQGSGVTITGSWPNQTIAATGSGGTITSVTASSPLASSGGATPNISFTGTLAVANGGTGNTTGAAASVATTNFSIVESGGKLVFKYGATAIALMDSSGNFTTLANVTACWMDIL